MTEGMCRLDGKEGQPEVAGQVRRCSGDALQVKVGRPAPDAHPGSINPGKPLVLAVSLRVSAHLWKESARERIASVPSTTITDEGALVQIAVQPLIRRTSARPAGDVFRHAVSERGGARQRSRRQISGGRHLAEAQRQHSGGRRGG